MIFLLLTSIQCSVKTDLMEIGANSTLLVAKVNKTDSGNYTCSIGESQQYTVLVHVLNGKSIMPSDLAFISFTDTTLGSNSESFTSRPPSGQVLLNVRVFEHLRALESAFEESQFSSSSRRNSISLIATQFAATQKQCIETRKENSFSSQTAKKLSIHRRWREKLSTSHFLTKFNFLISEEWDWKSLVSGGLFRFQLDDTQWSFKRTPHWCMCTAHK